MLVSILVCGKFGGVMGVMLAIPMAAMVVLLLRQQAGKHAKMHPSLSTRTKANATHRGTPPPAVDGREGAAHA
jgi:hypothetical protein